MKMREIQVSIKEPTWTIPFFCNTLQIQTSFPSEFAISNAWARQSSLASLSPCCALNTCGYRSHPRASFPKWCEQDWGKYSYSPRWKVYLYGTCRHIACAIPGSSSFPGPKLGTIQPKERRGCGEGRTISCWPIMTCIYKYIYIYVYNCKIFYCKNIHNLQEFCLGFKICPWFQIHGDSAEKDGVIWIHLALSLTSV